LRETAKNDKTGKRGEHRRPFPEKRTCERDGFRRRLPSAQEKKETRRGEKAASRKIERTAETRSKKRRKRVSKRRPVRR
jgi:hypothetical protein